MIRSQNAPILFRNCVKDGARKSKDLSADKSVMNVIIGGSSKLLMAFVIWLSITQIIEKV